MNEIKSPKLHEVTGWLMMQGFDEYYDREYCHERRLTRNDEDAVSIFFNDDNEVTRIYFLLQEDDDG